SYKDTAKRYGVDSTSLKEWVAKYRIHGLEGFQKSYTNYPIEFKMDVLHFMNDTGASTFETSSVFNIPSVSTVWNWKRLFDTGGVDALRAKKRGRPPMKKSKKQKPIEGSEEALRKENERLRMENAYLKKLQALIQEKEKRQNKSSRK
ncbi:helix-turn-helix domain-containing protein, partial [Fictibacillus sp. NRS-1165]|uniref:helix-turn-helix domain-containing protein n=1 Tax=Fictibacillus sp. NRS-1165 TaxID=3144463 RepID=UPI003D24A249